MNDTHQAEKLKLESFLSSLQGGLNSMRDVKRQFNRRAAFDFNSIELFEPNENRISKVLAFFLDPSASHGQGSSFLEALLKTPKLEGAKECYNSGEQISVITECQTYTKRRIDILIKFGDWKYAVGIENKIWGAEDQKDQIKDYAEFLDEKTQNAGGGYVLFYLTPEGVAPSDISITSELSSDLQDKKKLIAISFQEDIINIFSAFKNVCEAPNVRAFLLDFENFLRTTFRGERFMEEKKYIAEQVTKDQSAISTALDLIDAQWEIKGKLLSNFVQAVRDWAEDIGIIKGLSIMENYAPKRYDVFKLEVEGWSEHVITLGTWANPSLNNLHLGITRKDGQMLAKLDKLESAVEKNDHYGSTDYWHVGIALPPKYRHWESSSIPWREMYPQSEMMQWLKDETEKLINLVDELKVDL